MRVRITERERERERERKREREKERKREKNKSLEKCINLSAFLWQEMSMGPLEVKKARVFPPKKLVKLSLILVSKA
jgi:hypothetical protein